MTAEDPALATDEEQRALDGATRAWFTLRDADHDINTYIPVTVHHLTMTSQNQPGFGVSWLGVSSATIYWAAIT